MSFDEGMRVATVAFLLGFLGGITVATWLWLDAVKRLRDLHADAWKIANGWRDLLVEQLDETNPYGLAKINGELERRGLPVLRSPRP